MISMKKYIHILTTLFFLTFVSAQGLKLEGEILDSSNKSPLAFANIILEGTSLGAASDNEGRFIIEKIQAGTYTVIASYMGYFDIVLLLLQKKEIDTSLRFLEQTAMEWAQPETRCGVLEYLDGKISQEGRLKVVERLQTAL